MKKPKINNILLALLALCLFGATGCHEEKELTLLTGELPAKVKALYLIGNVTPQNLTWDINKPDLLVQSEEDPFVWTYHGALRSGGTFKLCMKTGTWAQPYIHPMVNNEPVNKTEISEKPMQAPRTGGADELWSVKEDGIYTLSFNLRNFTFSSVYEGPVSVDPGSGEVHLYLIGNATPKNPSWSVNDVDELIASEDDPDIYTYHGELLQDGRFKLGYKTGTWAQPWFHPAENNEPIGLEPVKDKKMQAPRQDGNDELWKCVKGGIYTLTFNTRELTWSSVYEGEVPQEPEEKPIEADMVYIVGNATTAGWTIANAIPMTRSTDDPYVFTWEGEIIKEDMFLFSLNNKDWKEMIRPVLKEQLVSTAPINDLKFKYPNTEDNNFAAKAKGIYKFTINLRTRTFSSSYKPSETIETEALYLVGNATPNNPGWTMDKSVQLVRSDSDKDVFTYHGQLVKGGTFKLCFQPGTWVQPWIHPMVKNEPVGTSNVTDKPMQAPRQGGDDELWHIEVTGIYTLTFNIRELTWSSVYEGSGEE